MKSILLITWANLKRRKIQTVLVGICIAMTALMFSTLVGVFLGMEAPFENLYARLKASHILMSFDTNMHYPEDVKNWFEEQEEVEKVSDPRMTKWMFKRLIYKEKELFKGTRLVEHAGNLKEHDNLIISEGEEKDYPGPGEIWIPNHWRNDSDMSVGDTVFVPTDDGLYPLIISAVVVDAHYSNGLASPSPSWVGPGGLSMMFPVGQLSGVQLGVRMKNAEDTELVWARFNQAFQYSGTGSRYEIFKRVFQIIYRFVAGLLTVFSLLGIFITIIITITVVNSAIKSDYKMIGMLKAQGFTNNNVISVYLFQFLLITFIAVPFGLFGSTFMVDIIFEGLIAAIGTVNFDVSLLIPAIYTFFAFLLGILIITYQTARKAGQISPVTAIRNGGPPPKMYQSAQFKYFTLKPKTSLPVFLGWRFLLSNKKRALTLFIGLLFVVFVQVFHINGTISAFDLEGNRHIWGLPEVDLRISQGTNFREFDEDNFKEEMEEDDRIDKVVPTGIYLANLPPEEDKAPDIFVGQVYNGELEDIGLENLEGRHPVFESEVSLGVISARKMNKSLGDTLELFMEGQLIPFSIVGIFQNIQGLGEGFKIQLEGIREYNPLFELDRYYLTLEKGEDVEAFREELQRTYGSTYKVQEASDTEKTLNSILDNLRHVMNLVALLFLGVLIVTVFNDTVLSIRENQKNLGIYKAIGMTPKQLQRALLFKALLIALFAVGIGIPLAVWIIPPSLSILTTDVGLVKVPYVTQWGPTMLTLPLVIILTVGSVWLASKRILGIKPRVLVRE